MSREAARQAIMTTFEAGWVGADAFPVERPNQPFSVPSSGAYGRLSIQFGARNPTTIGAGCTRQVGVVQLQVFNPEEKGTAAASKAGDLLATIFDLEQILIAPGHVVSFDLVGSNGSGQINGIEQENLAVDFRVDHHT